MYLKTRILSLTNYRIMFKCSGYIQGLRRNLINLKA